MNETIQSFESLFLNIKTNYSMLTTIDINLSLTQCRKLSVEAVQVQFEPMVWYLIYAIALFTMSGLCLSTYDIDRKYMVYYFISGAFVFGLLILSILGAGR